jgi:sarcosine oxidase
MEFGRFALRARRFALMHGTYDVIVLGVGGMGSAAAFELARRGRRVLGLEQFPFVHDRGSSHGQTRIIRKAYFEHPGYVPLLCRAYERWYDLEQRVGRHLFTECGCLTIGRHDSELVTGTRHAAQLHRLPIEEVLPAELRRRFPAFCFGEDYVGVLERDAGFLLVEDCVLAHIDACRSLGADLRENETVVSWEATGTGVVVRTRRQEFAAERLIVTAGSWAAQMLRELGLPLEVRRKVLVWFATADDSLFRRDVFPVYLTEVPNGIYYGFPVIDSFGHKVARHDGGERVENPMELDRTVTATDAVDCRRFVEQHLPAVSGPLRQGKVCMYTMTPDQHFVIDLHPQHERVAIAAGFSGHGFKFASVVGEILADLADKGRSELPIEMFGIGRFAKPQAAS